MDALTQGEYHWQEDAEPTEAEFLRQGAVAVLDDTPYTPGEETLNGSFGIYDAETRTIGVVGVDGLTEMPDGDEQPVARTYRVTGMDDEGRITGVEWGAEVREDWRAATRALEERDESGDERGEPAARRG